MFPSVIQMVVTKKSSVTGINAFVLAAMVSIWASMKLCYRTFQAAHPPLNQTLQIDFQHHVKGSVRQLSKVRQMLLHQIADEMDPLILFSVKD